VSTAVIVLADGFEEIEAVTPIDLLRRGGVTVTIAGLHQRTVTSKRGVTIACDALFEEVAAEWDILILPGGMPGAKNLSESPLLVKRVEETLERRARVGAICAAPAQVLGRHGFLNGRRFTGFPGAETQVTKGKFEDSPVVVDDLLTTSRGAGTAADFALSLLASLKGVETARQIAREILLPEREIVF